jgi:hypothetical protein
MAEQLRHIKIRNNLEFINNNSPICEIVHFFQRDISKYIGDFIDDFSFVSFQQNRFYSSLEFIVSL